MTNFFDDYRATDSFFLVPATLIKSSDDRDAEPTVWADLSRAERAIYPSILIGKRRGLQAVFGEDRLAKLSGLKTRASARVAANGLHDSGIISISKVRSTSGRQIKSYLTTPRQSFRYFPFYAELIYSGWWASISHAAQAVYVAMRALSKPRPDIDEDHGVWPQNDDEFAEYLASRSVDFCLDTITNIARFSGISRRSFPAAINELIRCGMAGIQEDAYTISLRLP